MLKAFLTDYKMLEYGSKSIICLSLADNSQKRFHPFYSVTCGHLTDKEVNEKDFWTLWANCDASFSVFLSMCLNCIHLFVSLDLVMCDKWLTLIRIGL